MEEDEKEEVIRFSEFCPSLDVGGQSLSQAVGMMVRVLQHCPGMLGRYSLDLLKGSAPSGTGRLRDALPRRCRSSQAEGLFKVKGGKLSGGKVKATYRRVGVDCLTYCVVVALTCLRGGMSETT